MTVAGNGSQGSEGAGGPATSANLNYPYGVCLDQSGNLFIAEFGNARVSRVDAATGILTIAAGTGQPGYSGDGGQATLARLSYPFACAVDATGNLFIADGANNVVRRVDAATGIIATAAGTGVPEFSGDGGPASAAGLRNPGGLAFDAAGNLYIADEFNHRIRRIDAATGIITTIAGAGFYDVNHTFDGDGGPATSALLYYPFGVAVDAANNVYISDTGNARIRRIDAVTGIITTIAGNGQTVFTGDGAPATSLGIARPGHLAVDSSGYLFFAGGDSGRVRRLTLATGMIVTVAGIGTNYWSRGDGGPATSADMSMPTGLAIASDGNLLVSENGLLAAAGGGQAMAASGTRELAPPSDQGHRVRRIFLPAPQPYTAAAVVSSQSTSATGEPVTFTATVIPIGASGIPTGTVQFFDDLNFTGYGERPLVGTASLVNGTASLTTSTLSNGFHSITAVYSGDGVFSSSASAAIPQSVLVATSVTLATDQNPSDPNQPVTLTATVVPEIVKPWGPAGTVEFRDGGVSLGTAEVSSNRATLAVTFTTPGEHSLTAVYSGDTNYAGSTSPLLTQRVRTASTATVASAPNPSTYGSSVTITASVVPAAATGTVEFRVDGVSIGSAPLTAGQASIAYTSMAAGTRTIAAVYSGDANYEGSTSTPLAHTVSKVTTTTSVASTPNPSNAGAAVTITAAVAPAAATGTVEFRVDGVAVGTATLAGGQASIAYSAMSAGDRAITAVYSGDANYEGSTSTPLTHVVSKLTTTTSVASTPNPSNAGAAVTITAAVAPAATGTVEFRVDGVAVGTAPLAGGQASIAYSAMAAGSRTITAAYSGDANNENSSSQPLAHLVKAATTTSVAAAPNPSIQGGAVTITAAVSPAAATGTVEFRVDGAEIGAAPIAGGQAAIVYSAMSPGNHTITAVYAGDGSHVGSTSPPLAQMVKATTATALASSIQPSTFAQAVQFVATVSPSSATGTVQFLDGALVLGAATLSGGQAALSLSNLAAGDHAITAVYAGSASHAGSTSAVLIQTVLKASPTAAVTSSPDPSVWSQAVTLVGWPSMASATGTMQFKDGATILGTAPIVGGTATLVVSTLAVGSHSITAVYSGDANHNPATAPAVSHTVNKAPAGVTVVSNLNPATRRQAITFTAAVAPAAATGTVTFLDGTTSLGTVTLTNGTASITKTLATGTHSITARYNGDAHYLISTSPPLNQVVTK